MIGSRLGPYEITARLGAGGMGEVYEAQDLRLERKVAVKFLPADAPLTAEARRRFAREARAASAIDHPHICAVHDVGESDGRPYLVMERLEGETLAQRLTRGRLPLADWLRLGMQMADALEAAHGHGILHRDLKPGNVFLTRRGDAKVLDFGLAALAADPAATTLSGTAAAPLTAPGGVMGTVAYMSPEQARGEPLDARSDLFALGVVLYEMIAGRRPFRGETAAAVFGAILGQAPAPMRDLDGSLPAAVDALLAKALEKDREDRYQSAHEMLVDLRRLARGSAPQALAALPRTSSRRLRRRRLLAASGVVAGVVTLALAAAWQLGRAPSRGDPRAAESGPAPAAVAAGVPSLAVLPFADLSPGRDQEYFSDGLTDELIATLAKLGRLRVTGRTSSFYFKGRNASPREIGEMLDVSHLLAGSVRKDGDRLRVTAQLAGAADGLQLWSQTYDRELDDVFAVQEEIARAVAEALQVALLPGTPVAPRPIDPGAYSLLLEARSFLRQGTGEGAEKAIGLLQQAMELAPDEALLWTELGLAYGRLATRVATRAEREEAHRRARSAQSRALQLDPFLPRAHARIAHLYRRGWEFGAAAASVKRALELAPNEQIVLSEAAIQAAFEGRPDEAIAAELRILEGDPLAAPTHFNLAWHYFIAGRLDEAEDRWRKVLTLSPHYPGVYWGLGVVNLERGRLDEAKADFEREEAFPWQRLQGLALHAHATGDRAAAEAALRRFVAAYGAERPTLHALLRAHRGEADEAFRLLEGALAGRDIDLLWLGAQIPTNPLFAELRRDPRWPAFAARLPALR